MYTRIPLRLTGIDLRSPEAYTTIPDDLSNLGFEANGGVSFAVFATEDQRPIGEAVDWARCIAKHMPGVAVSEVYDELASTADIAARCEVGAEAVRLWITGRRRTASRPFPAPRQVVGVGARPMSLWAWREVLSWVREVVGLDPDEGVTYLDDAQLAELNGELAAIGSSASTGAWRPLESGSVSVRATHVETVKVGTSVVATLERIDETLYDARVVTRASYTRRYT